MTGTTPSLSNLFVCAARTPPTTLTNYCPVCGRQTTFAYHRKDGYVHIYGCTTETNGHRCGAIIER